MELTRSRTLGLLVICHHDGERTGRIWRIDRHLNVLDEEYFHFSWPETTPVIDDRDVMHQRGWTYFQVNGRLGDREVTGMGCLPFVHASAREHFPWLKLDIGTQLTLIDTPGGAGILDGSGRVVERLPGGSFFQGLPRPWMGLHCIDTVRRDAAQCRLRFETTCDDAASAKITVRANEVTLVYTVDMETDVIDRIEFFTGAPIEANRTEVLDFVYLQEIPEPECRTFEAPREPGRGADASRAPGLLWLKDLTTGRQTNSERGAETMNGKEARQIGIGLLAILWLSQCDWAGRIIYVDSRAPRTGVGDGSTWEHAYLCLQNALEVAQAGDEIRVAQGVYKPDEKMLIPRTRSSDRDIEASGDVDASFVLLNGVVLKGGYAGTTIRTRMRATWIPTPRS